MPLSDCAVMVQSESLPFSSKLGLPSHTPEVKACAGRQYDIAVAISSDATARAWIRMTPLPRRDGRPFKHMSGRGAMAWLPKF